MDDHQNDGHISRSIVGHHTKDIACSRDNCSGQMRDVEGVFYGPVHGLADTQVLQAETRAVLLILPCMALLRGHASCDRIEWGTVTKYVNM